MACVHAHDPSARLLSTPRHRSQVSLGQLVTNILGRSLFNEMRVWGFAVAVVVVGVGVRRLIPTAAVSGDLYALLGASPAASDADLKK